MGDRICVMYNGKIQQVAPPMEVYDKPVNRFVAGFLGTPAMNFFNGTIKFTDSKPAFVLKDGTAIKLSGSNGKLLSYTNREMVFGVRPEHLSIEQIPGRSGNSIGASVDVVEPLGDRKDVYLTADNSQKFIANLSPHVNIEIGQKVEIFVDTDKTHIFEPTDTGVNVSL